MTKKTLIRLGKLWRLESELFNLSLGKSKDNEDKMKYLLVRKVKKNLEEQKRGFLKSKIPYSSMADFIIENVNNLDYQSLHTHITKIALR